MKRHNSKQQGFTLTELMIVVALAAIFATFAVPNMGNMAARQKVQSQASEIASALTFAHNEAVRSGKPVFVVPAKIKDDGKLNGSVDKWSEKDRTENNALLVFSDIVDNSGTGTSKKEVQQYDAGEDLRIVPLNKNIEFSITQEALGSTVSGTHDESMAITYYSNGQMRIGKINNKKISVTEAPGAIGRIVVKDSKKKTKNQANRFCEVVRINATGRASVYTGKRSNLQKNDKNNFFYCD